MGKKEQIERLKEMQRLYEVENLTLREIAEHFGVSWQAIHERLVKAGVPMRQKSPVKRFLDRETLVQLYIEESLTIGETAKRLKTDYNKVSQELGRHGIEKRSKGYFKRKHPELYQLNVGEKTIIKRPTVTNPYRNLYKKAQKIGIQISIKTINVETLQIYRKK
jgi:predicted DNA-binding protein YlxM (UPF0122 family)